MGNNSAGVGDSANGPQGSNPWVSRLNNNPSLRMKKTGAGQLKFEGIIDDVAAEELVLALPFNTETDGIELIKTRLTDAGLASIANGLKTDTKIAYLIISDIIIGDSGSAALGEMLKENSTLRYLGLVNNSLSTQGVRLLAEGLKQNTSVTTLNLSHSSLGSSEMMHVGSLLAKNSTIKILDLRNNGMGNDGMANLRDGLRINKSIERLFLSQNDIGDDGVYDLDKALTNNLALLELDLTQNDIGEAGAVSVANIVNQNTRLKALVLGNCRIGNRGCNLIAAALRWNKGSLRKLDLTRNGIDGIGAASLGEMLKENNALRDLTMPENLIGAAGAKSLADGLKLNQGLCTLNVERNRIGDEGATALAEAMLSNPKNRLELLILRRNEIGDSGAEELAKVLKSNRTLRSLYVNMNKINLKGYQALADAFEINQTVNKLQYDGDWVATDDKEGSAVLTKLEQVNNDPERKLNAGSRFNGRGGQNTSNLQRAGTQDSSSVSEATLKDVSSPMSNTSSMVSTATIFNGGPSATVVDPIAVSATESIHTPPSTLDQRNADAASPPETPSPAWHGERNTSSLWTVPALLEVDRSMKGLLGQGGFGQVFKGKLQKRDEIAVKELHESLGDEKIQQAFDYEMNVWAKVPGHDNGEAKINCRIDLPLAELTCHYIDILCFHQWSRCWAIMLLPVTSSPNFMREGASKASCKRTNGTCWLPCDC